MQSTTFFPEVSQKPTSEIFPESAPHGANSRKMSKQAHELKEVDEEEEFFSSTMIEKDWIKIGDEYLQNPVAVINPPEIPIKVAVINPPEIPVNEIVTTDPLFECGKIPRPKRKFEDGNQGEAEIPKNAFIKNRPRIWKEKYVKLHLINPRFKSKAGEVEEEEEEDDVTLPYSFRTKRRYLYHDLKI